MVWGSVRDVEPAWPDVPVDSGQDPPPRRRRRRVFRRRPGQPPTAPRAQGGDGKNRRNSGSVIPRVLRRLWIPLVVLVVVAVGAMTVSRLHGLFGSEKNLSYSDTRADNKPYNPQRLTYEVFGPPGTVALISYFGAHGYRLFLE